MNRSLNPFTTDTEINYNLWPLLYDSLTEPDGHFDPQMRLASSVRVSGTQMFVTLRSGVLFTDGTAFTSDDAVYSLQVAMSTTTGPFYSRTAEFASVSANGPLGLVVTLKSPDPLASNLLDIPMIKKGSDRNGWPTGTGRYAMKSAEKNRSLAYNPKWYGNRTPVVRTINLLDMPDNSAVANCLSIGDLDYVLTDDGTRTMSVVNDDSTYVNFNQLLYMGVNRGNAALADPNVRRALSLAVDRATIVKEIYSSHAIAVTWPFNPTLSGFPKQSASALAPNLTEAVSALAKSGYTVKNGNGILQKGSSALDFTLLVNKGNSQRCAVAQKFADECKNIGVNIKVNTVDAASLLAALQKNQFDLYLGEYRLTADMDLSPFFAAGGAVCYGNTAASGFYTAFSKWRAGGAKLSDLTADFDRETPFIPVCYRLGAVSYPRGFYGNIAATGDNIFYNIQDWT